LLWLYMTTFLSYRTTTKRRLGSTEHLEGATA